MFCRLAGESCHVAGWCIGWHLKRWNQMSMKESRLPHWSCHLVQALLLLQERRFTLFPTEKKPKDKLDISGAKEFMQIHFTLRFLGCKEFPWSCWSSNNSFLLPAWQTCSANLALSKHTAILNVCATCRLSSGKSYFDLLYPPGVNGRRRAMLRLGALWFQSLGARGAPYRCLGNFMADFSGTALPSSVVLRGFMHLSWFCYGFKFFCISYLNTILHTDIDGTGERAIFIFDQFQ